MAKTTHLVQGRRKLIYMIKINNIIKYKLTYFKNHLDTYIKKYSMYSTGLCLL